MDCVKVDTYFIRDGDYDFLVGLLWNQVKKLIREGSIRVLEVCDSKNFLFYSKYFLSCHFFQQFLDISKVLGKEWDTKGGAQQIVSCLRMIFEHIGVRYLTVLVGNMRYMIGFGSVYSG